MGDRKGDTIIYIIYGFFFACIIGGGVFLCLYMIQPDDSESITWSPKSPPIKTSNFNSCDAKSPLHSPLEGRERRVHFGVVVEMEDGDGDDDGQEHRHHKDDTEKLQS
ncbi:hypothetical protein Lalb_Chr13g0290981 [Lupinus albus]|uniref:Transmembrane protein n=1 Tax=Lupinus albus TaxID=3870 RepID=A0A6A4PH64_LUPAL|nr:hypothetical protein Lalb_Chr13g0290981 [Lupinus albus]